MINLYTWLFVAFWFLCAVWSYGGFLAYLQRDDEKSFLGHDRKLALSVSLFGPISLVSFWLDGKLGYGVRWW